MSNTDVNGGLENDLVHVARLALAGREQDVQMYLRRMLKRYQDLPDFTSKIGQLLQESPTRSTPLRSSSVRAVPVDVDSRLQLVRLENPVSLEIEPIWNPEILAKLSQVIKERKNEKGLTSVGLDPTKTVLFVGAPGVGKTLAARWLARELQRPLLTLDLSAVMSSFLGKTGTNLRHVLDYAKSLDCVLLLDELDAIAKRRDDAVEVGELKRLVTVLLQEIDDWPAHGVLVAATNHPDLLDPAVWRRFELTVDFPMPTDTEVQSAIKLFLANPDITEKWIEILVTLFHGESFSTIERTLSRVRREAAVDNQLIEERIRVLVEQHVSKLSRKERADVAVTLHDLNLSQRKIQQITGVSRDTLRKKLTNG